MFMFVVDLDGDLFPNLDGDRTETNLAKRIPNSDQKPPKAKRTAYHQRDVHLSTYLSTYPSTFFDMSVAVLVENLTDIQPKE